MANIVEVGRFAEAMRYVTLARMGWTDPTVDVLDLIECLFAEFDCAVSAAQWDEGWSAEEYMDSVFHEAELKYQSLADFLTENGHGKLWLEWRNKYNPKESNMAGNVVPDSAIGRLKSAIESANAPLIQSLTKLAHNVSQLVLVMGAQLKESSSIEGLREAAEDIVDETAAQQQLPEPDPSDFDMESAIKASGQWECGDIHCNGCPLDQNMDCLQTYGFMDTAEKAAGGVNTDDEFRIALHRTMRDVVPAAALTARRPAAAKVTFTVPDAPKPSKPVSDDTKAKRAAGLAKARAAKAAKNPAKAKPVKKARKGKK